MELELKEEPTLEERVEGVLGMVAQLSELIKKIIFEADRIGYIKGFSTGLDQGEQYALAELKGE